MKDAKVNFDWASEDAAQAKDKFAQRRVANAIEPNVQKQLKKGSVLACISSRPGQSGRVDGYILEGHELEFYQKKMLKKK